MNESSPVWVAHRGQARDHPENTLAAIQAALECGAQYIEVDVQCSKDGELYLMHDALLSRTVGIPDSLLEMTSEQIEALSAYEPDRLGATFRGESIPKLSDLAELISGWSGTRLFVEIKQESILARGVDDLLQRLTVVMEKVRRQCIVISFSLPFIHAVKDQGVFDTGWIIQDYDDVSISTATGLCPDFVLVDYKKVPEGQVLVDGTWQWVIYVINEPGEAAAWSTLKPNFVETSDICRFVRHGDRGGVEP